MMYYEVVLDEPADEPVSVSVRALPLIRSCVYYLMAAVHLHLHLGRWQHLSLSAD